MNASKGCTDTSGIEAVNVSVNSANNNQHLNCTEVDLSCKFVLANALVNIISVSMMCVSYSCC